MPPFSNGACRRAAGGQASRHWRSALREAASPALHAEPATRGRRSLAGSWKDRSPANMKPIPGCHSGVDLEPFHAFRLNRKVQSKRVKRFAETKAGAFI